MKRKLSVISLLLIVSALNAGQRGKLVFEDDFDRNESQETTEEIGNGWNSNSAKRAGGHKQVDLKNGAMYIYRHETADHGVSVTHPAEFRNGSVSIRFMLEKKDDSLGLNFADLKFKEVHAGHLFAVRVSPSSLLIEDLKTGKMDLETRNLRKAQKLSKARADALKSKSKRIPHKLDTEKWYQLHVSIIGDTLSVSIEGEEVGSFSSKGIAHPTKRTLRLAVPKNAVVDDLVIHRKT